MCLRIYFCDRERQIIDYFTDVYGLQRVGCRNIGIGNLWFYDGLEWSSISDSCSGNYFVLRCYGVSASCMCLHKTVKTILVVFLEFATANVQHS